MSYMSCHIFLLQNDRYKHVNINIVPYEDKSSLASVTKMDALHRVYLCLSRGDGSNYLKDLVALKSN